MLEPAASIASGVAFGIGATRVAINRQEETLRFELSRPLNGSILQKK